MANETHSIVVGFDGTPGSHDALRLGGLLARALGEELQVAIALPYEPLPLPVEAYDDALEQHFEALFDSAARDLEPMEFRRRELRERTPARALTELAESEPVDSLVIGSAEHGEMRRACPGRVGERLLTGAPCAVAIAPRGYATEASANFSVVGVAYDGTPEAQLGLELGERLARSAGARLRVIAVLPKVNVAPSRIGHTARGYQKVLRTHFEEALEEVGTRLGGDIDSELVLLEGPPAACLATATEGLDLMIIGSRGYGPVRRALLGGTASDLVRTAHSPVLVVPRG